MIPDVTDGQATAEVVSKIEESVPPAPSPKKYSLHIRFLLTGHCGSHSGCQVMFHIAADDDTTMGDILDNYVRRNWPENLNDLSESVHTPNGLKILKCGRILDLDENVRDIFSQEEISTETTDLRGAGTPKQCVTTAMADERDSEKVSTIAKATLMHLVFLTPEVVALNSKKSKTAADDTTAAKNASSTVDSGCCTLM